MILDKKVDVALYKEDGYEFSTEGVQQAHKVCPGTLRGLDEHEMLTRLFDTGHLGEINHWQAAPQDFVGRPDARESDIASPPSPADVANGIVASKTGGSLAKWDKRDVKVPDSNARKASTVSVLK